MPHLQVKEVNPVIYESLKLRAKEDNRSISQEVLAIIRDFLALKKEEHSRNAARVLLQLAGAWEGDTDARQLIKELRNSRRNISESKANW